uniref:Fungal lipase-type domain-containing protein n=1 Tax=Cyclophora tenuis TaxID=216820 RepID=A0A7S1GIG2_CYCTE|mmetsp:Transcript_17502/g.29698  ORF Transcript_17502/g.29698 Transcript_17502/m.29698 type:complete len:427 (+) Transcript_17502:50-1330(+)
MSSTSRAPPVEAGVFEKFHLKSGNGAQLVNAQGRVYSTKYSLEPSGIQADDVIYGIKMAHMSCTDDSEGRLSGSGANTLEALRHIVGGEKGEEEIRKPLSTLLKDHFDLTMDCWIDESGLKKGRAVDTQGFIASNDDTIVLSYRFSTSLLDWVTNLSMTTSEWEPNQDALIGHAGFCSCFDGWVYKALGKGKPRVHTGFYNNFIYTIPHIQRHIVDKIKDPNDLNKKKIYICGCSLGAAIATMAFCYLLLELPWETLPHKLISVTAGCPRVCDRVMHKTIMDRLEELRPYDRAVLCRCVYNEDLVPHIPFNVAGFIHLDKLVYITKEGDVLVNPKLRGTKNFSELKRVFTSFWQEKKRKKAEATTTKTTNGAESESQEAKTPFQKEVESTPGPIKDHMPYWYLTFMERLKEREEAQVGEPSQRVIL